MPHRNSQKLPDHIRKFFKHITKKYQKVYDSLFNFDFTIKYYGTYYTISKRESIYDFIIYLMNSLSIIYAIDKDIVTCINISIHLKDKEHQPIKIILTKLLSYVSKVSITSDSTCLTLKKWNKWTSLTLSIHKQHVSTISYNIVLKYIFHNISNSYIIFQTYNGASCLSLLSKSSRSTGVALDNNVKFNCMNNLHNTLIYENQTLKSINSINFFGHSIEVLELNNIIMDFDISKLFLPNLYKLVIRQNPLSYDNLFKILKNNTTIIDLNCILEYSLKFEPLHEYLIKNTHITKLQLVETNMESNLVKNILSMNTTLINFIHNKRYCSINQISPIIQNNFKYVGIPMSFNETQIEMVINRDIILDLDSYDGDIDFALSCFEKYPNHYGLSVLMYDSYKSINYTMNKYSQRIRKKHIKLVDFFTEY